MLGVQCSRLCSCGAVYRYIYVYVALWSPQAAVCVMERVLLLCALLRVARRFIGRSLQLSAAVVAQQRWRWCCFKDPSSWSCSVVALLPSDALPT
jgi:hypothetical protein